MIRKFSGRIWKLRDDVDTDIIMPTQYLSFPTVEEMKPYAFEPLRPELAAQLRPGDILVGGRNFGCGSSREQAAAVLKAFGISCIIAKSFARIFFRNSINNGMLLIESDLYDHCEEGDKVTVEINKAVTCRGKEYAIPKVPEDLMKILDDGGLVKSMKRLNGVER
ncbi:3-isopropylmalate dehydratase [uncultured Pyramidobacter sp.]|uniref:LeuD/DmdB family oxidoreductase small subunit n=1 Tax=uncultured Pyramidobacter sp. TaxID=1623495 RepID=UPI002586DC93|nr:3-isopropylmalate dehydratase [uncultured Pyramidobacter sp.]